MQGEGGAGGAANEQIRQIAMPLYQARVWMKLIGVISIIQGVLAAFTIIGLVVAWLPIWIGVLLFQSASRAEESYVSGDVGTLMESLGKIRTYFTIYGVMTLIMLLFMMFWFFIVDVGIMGGFMNM